MPEEFFEGVIKERDIVKEMSESYLNYSMSVIVSRALPDVRDGLKPVQRRILHSMRELDDGRFNKVANIIVVNSTETLSTQSKVSPRGREFKISPVRWRIVSSILRRFLGAIMGATVLR